MGITMKDVAREAGVSVSTVSKVLNDGASISGATKEHVREIMRRLQYQPNEQARNFARQKTNNVVFLSKLEKHTAFKNPHMFEIMCGAEEILSTNNYNLSFKGIKEDIEALNLVKDIVGRKSADGIIIHGSVTSKELVDLLVKSEYPHIIIGRPFFKCSACWIDINNSISGQMAAEHLTKCGYERIAFVGGPKSDEISSKRLNGFISAIHDHGYHVRDKYIKYGDYSKESGYELGIELLQEKEPPEAIICENNQIALGVVKAINFKNKKIPEDIAIITFDDFPLSRMIDPLLTVVDIDVYDMGYQAGTILMRKIISPELHVQSYTTLPRLIVRDSTINKNLVHK
ncbi:LacI family DNA-binding transcriptional regulator [Anaeromicropila herbilytica]|uniref:LacI family transcriptional regulator n=1 Tax=Anaeromicropila herbilytica TaxID=2785025 RepID=A0A7R7EMH5_9FIRM|nr:LacI family DNA-binding transcriptional regulator [Anaeromicropila herbilytica]BCN31336.1 LacI family transcriptional regulator [Anaeromicropila herbilytica]